MGWTSGMVQRYRIVSFCFFPYEMILEKFDERERPGKGQGARVPALGWTRALILRL